MRHKRISPFTLILLCAAFIAACLLMGSGFSNDSPKTAASEITYTYEANPIEKASRTVVGGGIVEEEEDVSVATEPPLVVEEQTYTDDDLDLLSRIIYAEVGCTWIPDEVQLYTGSVVLNRVSSPLFPDTLYEVIYQEGQYSPTWNGSIDNEPDERTIENARILLADGSVIPENVVFQANFTQGTGIYHSYYDETLGTTTYFCYGNS